MPLVASLVAALLALCAFPTAGTAAQPDQVHVSWVGNPATTLTIVWHTASTSTPSLVEYRKAGTSAWQTASGSLRPSGTSGKLHEVTLAGLSPATEYDYRVRADDGSFSDPYSTRTAPAAGAPAPLDAVYFADTGLAGRHDGLANGTLQGIDEIAALDPQLLLPGGDYAYFDGDTRFGTLDATIDEWFNQEEPIFSRPP